MLRRHLLLPAALLLAGLTPGCSPHVNVSDDVPYVANESELSEAPEYADGESIPRLAEVSPGIYRGGEPGEAGMAELVEMGVKTIIDLRYDGWPDESQEEIDEEAERAKAVGIEHMAIGFSAYRSIPDGQIDRVLKALADPDLRPIFVHCKRGRDRTGLVVALHRVLNEGVTHDRAYQEMIQMGFRKRYFQMLRYFDRKTAGLP